MKEVLAALIVSVVRMLGIRRQVSERMEGGCEYWYRRYEELSQRHLALLNIWLDYIESSPAPQRPAAAGCEVLPESPRPPVSCPPHVASALTPVEVKGYHNNDAILLYCERCSEKRLMGRLEYEINNRRLPEGWTLSPSPAVASQSTNGTLAGGGGQVLSEV